MSSDRVLPNRKQLRLLVAKEDIREVGVLANLFRGLHFQVTSAYTGVQALAAARDTPCDLLLIDLKLPDMSGLDVIRSLRIENRECAFIVLSAHATVPLVIEAMKLGALDVIDTPFRPDLVVQAVCDALGPGMANEHGNARKRELTCATRSVRTQAAALMTRESRFSVPDRLAMYIISAIDCKYDPKTIKDWASQANVGPSTIREHCRLVHVEAHDARDFGRVLRSIWRSGYPWMPEAILDCADARTLNRLIERSGLQRRVGGLPPSVEEFLETQKWIPADNPTFGALSTLLSQVRVEGDFGERAAM
jgi:DNA-binding response OmpR family regulator